jgi:uncharacterized membrane protein
MMFFGGGMLLFWLLLLVVIIAAVGGWRSFGGVRSDQHRNYTLLSPTQETPEETLRTRYAKGEIGREEYVEMLETLRT